MPRRSAQSSDEERQCTGRGLPPHLRRRVHFDQTGKHVIEKPVRIPITPVPALALRRSGELGKGGVTVEVDVVDGVRQLERLNTALSLPILPNGRDAGSRCRHGHCGVVGGTR